MYPGGRKAGQSASAAGRDQEYPEDDKDEADNYIEDSCAGFTCELRQPPGFSGAHEEWPLENGPKDAEYACGDEKKVLELHAFLSVVLHENCGSRTGRGNREIRIAVHTLPGL